MLPRMQSWPRVSLKQPCALHGDGAAMLASGPAATQA